MKKAKVRMKPVRKAPARGAKRKVARPSAERDTLASAVSDLVKISAEMRDLLVEIRELLAISVAEASEEVGTIVVAETEGEEGLEEEA